MSDGGYAWEKLYLAVRILAGNDGELRARLRDAHRYSLMLLLKPETDFPWPEVRGRFETLAEGLRDEAIERSQPEELRKVAQEIVDIFAEVARLYGAAR